MAEWWEFGDTGFNLDSGFDVGGLNLGFDPNLFSGLDDFNFNFEMPQLPEFNFTFDPGAFDLGFNPSFDLGQYTAQFNDPFALPQGDLSLPTMNIFNQQPFDLGSALAQDSGGFNLGQFSPSIMAGLTPGSFDIGSQMLGAEPVAGPALAPTANVAEPFDPKLDLGQYGGGSLSLGGNLAGAASLMPGTNVGAASGDKFLGMSDKQWDSALGLSKLGLGLGGSLLGAFGPPPKMNAMQAKEIQAKIDAMYANTELEKEKLKLQAEMAKKVGGGGGGGGGISRSPLFGTDPRFSTLYDQVTAAQQGLSPNNPEIQAMTQQIYSVQQQAAMKQFEDQKAQVLEQANMLGINPAAQLAQIQEAEQQQMQKLFVEAQQQALAFAQGKLDPSNQLLQTILGTVV